MGGLFKEGKRRLRRARRLRRHAATLPHASVVFISPAKCGRTWVRAMMSYGYHKAFGTPADAIVDGRAFHAIDARIPIFFFTHLSKERLGLRRQLGPAALAQKTVIALIRDPRDAAVSRYHHELHRSQSRQSQPDVATDGADPLFDYVCNAPHGLGFYIDSLNRLKPFAESHPDFHLFTYEAFKRDARGELARLLAVASTPLPDDAVAAAVDFTRFEAMQKREAEGFYQTKMLRRGDPLEPSSFKVRRGKVGGYKDELLPADVVVLDQLVDERLVKGFGYRSDERVAAAVVHGLAVA